MKKWSGLASRLRRGVKKVWGNKKYRLAICILIVLGLMLTGHLDIWDVIGHFAIHNGLKTLFSLLH